MTLSINNLLPDRSVIAEIESLRDFFETTPIESKQRFKGIMEINRLSEKLLAEAGRRPFADRKWSSVKTVVKFLDNWERTEREAWMAHKERSQ